MTLGIAPDDWSQLAQDREMPAIDADRMAGYRLERVRGELKRAGASMGVSANEYETTPDIEHPLVGIHPENGRPFLYPGALYDFENSGIKPLGMDENEGASLYEELKTFALDGRFIHRHEWKVGDILACDNLAAMHCATPFDESANLRILHRVTIKGVAPSGA